MTDDAPTDTAAVTLPALPPGLHCPQCSYNLQGCTSDLCPECSHDVSELRCERSVIPWARRTELGWFMGFWRTVFLVMFRPGRLAIDMARPISYRDARRFAGLVLLHGYAVVVALTTAWLMDWQAPEVVDPFDLPWMPDVGPALADRATGEVWPIVLLLLAGFLWSVGAILTPGYFFAARTIPTQQQDNAISLSYYTCAPLACLGLFVLIVRGVVWVFSDVFFIWGLTAPGLASPELTAAMVVVVLVWWRAAARRMARRVMPQLRGRRLVLGLGLPFAWLGWALVTLVALPLAVVYVLIVVLSLW